MSVDAFPQDPSQEPTTPTRLGSGSFATVYSFPGRAIVAKVIHVEENAAEIEAEFHALHRIHAKCSSDTSIFTIPRAHAFYNPQTQVVDFYPPPPHTRGTRQRRFPNCPFDPASFADLPSRACYVMDRAAPLPTSIGQAIRSKFYNDKGKHLPIPLMCRLYFGRELRPSAFVNPCNFPLDVARYASLQQECPEALDAIEEVVEGMGEMLSRIHWVAGYDARDVEFVMAGSLRAFTVQLYVIDYNQVRARLLYELEQRLGTKHLLLNYRCVHSTRQLAT